MIDFEALGFKDITEDKPIRFLECLGEFFEWTCPYNKRYYRKDGCIEIELKVGKDYNFYFISGICYYFKGWEKFEITGLEEGIIEYLNKTLIAVKNNILENIERHFNYYGILRTEI